MNYIASMVFFILFVYIALIKYRTNSSVGKSVFNKCQDPEIIQAFNNTNVTGTEFIKLLLNDNSKIKIINKKTPGNGAWVRFNKVFLNKDFSSTLSLETFRDSLHEYKHIQDNKYCKLQNILNYFIFITLITPMILLLLGLIIKINKTIVLIRFIITIIGIFMSIISQSMCLTIENDAIRFVVTDCKKWLFDFKIDPNVVSKIYDFLSIQASYICEWYSMQIISALLLLLSIFFISI